MPNEIELKLRIAEVDCSRFFAHPALDQYLTEGPVTRRLTSYYYDTSDLALLDAGISLRVRHMSGGWFQAVKAAGSSVAGLHQRMEWEDIIADNRPDFSKITEPAIASIFADTSLRQSLRPIFITDVERTEWQLTKDGCALEVALDVGELLIGSTTEQADAREPIREVEIELKQGDPVHVFELARMLQADIPLVIENVSKAQRGYAHYRPVPHMLSAIKPIGLSKDATEREILHQMAWESLRQLQSHQDSALLADATLGPEAHAQLCRAADTLHALAQQLNQPMLAAEFLWLITELRRLAPPFWLQPMLPDASHPFGHQLQQQCKIAAEESSRLMQQWRIQAALLQLGAILLKPYS